MPTEQTPQPENRFGHNRHVFLLRIWRENGRLPWFIMLQSVNEANRHNFTTLEALTAHLENLLEDKIE